MIINFLYTTSIGRCLLKIIHNTHLLKHLAWFLRKPASKRLIKPYIERNHVDMSEFEGVEFESFADFFARKKEKISFVNIPEMLISPCDGLLSIYHPDDKTWLKIKGSYYNLHDLISDKRIADSFSDGICLVIRLCASDYHHFCYLDDCYKSKSYFTPGLLHSVQPIACKKEPVYRLNRRMWSLLETKNFGLVAQIEIGALLVGEIVHENEYYWATKGEEMGHFELAGSTIVLLFQRKYQRALKFFEPYAQSIDSDFEVRVTQGEAIATIKNKKENK